MRVTALSIIHTKININSLLGKPSKKLNVECGIFAEPYLIPPPFLHRSIMTCKVDFCSEPKGTPNK